MKGFKKINSKDNIVNELSRLTEEKFQEIIRLANLKRSLKTVNSKILYKRLCGKLALGGDAIRDTEKLYE